MRLSSRPPLARLVAIDLALRAGGWPNASTLGRQLEVSPRTVQRDLLFLRDRLQAPVSFDAVRNGYYYTQADYRLPFFRLTEGELVALFLAGRLLHQYRGTPYDQDLHRAFARLTEMLPDAVSVNLSAVADALSVTPTAVSVQDIEIFRTLSGGVVNHRQLELDYWTAGRDEVNRRRVDPYHLTLIDGDWYLIGHCHLRQGVRMFSAVRVRGARYTGASFERPVDFRVDSYLDGSFRSVRGDGRYRVELRFSTAYAGRIAEKIWHKSQTTETLPDGRLLLCFDVSDLREIKRWVLSWGAQCEVMEPPELQDMVRDEAEVVARQYAPGAKPKRRGARRE
jgi:predicted DNA-binding transcriptional regulator YafY